jgi:hypothetical protein
MGLDLSLLPVEAEFGDGTGFSHSVLALERRTGLFDAILDIEEREGAPVPGRFETFVCRDDRFEETHYGDTRETPYGEPLLWVRAASLAELRSHPEATDFPRNRAVFAYVDALPPDTKVALYWH